MSILMFNILQYAKKLREAGVPEKQAEAQAEALAEIMEEKFDAFATKEDFKKLAIATKEDIKNLETSLRNDMNSMETSLRQEIAIKISDFKVELVRWLLGASVAQSAIIISCLKFIH